MKQVTSLLLMALMAFIGYTLYGIYGEKDYKSKYKQILISNNIEIKKIDFDKEKIDKLNKKIQELTVDDTYKLKLYNLKGIEQQPLFIDNYAKIYDKILQQQRTSNNFNK